MNEKIKKTIIENEKEIIEIYDEYKTSGKIFIKNIEKINNDYNLAEYINSRNLSKYENEIKKMA